VNYDEGLTSIEREILSLSSEWLEEKAGDARLLHLFEGL
jgi:hypothetical protein